MSSSARVTTPADVLDRLRPDVWVKGGDYARGEPAEAPVVRRYGGETVLLPHTSHSTSRIVAAVMQAIYNGHSVVPGEQVRIRKAHWARRGLVCCRTGLVRAGSALCACRPALVGRAVRRRA